MIIELNARTGPRSIDVRRSVLEVGGRPLAGSKWVIFIHGFNTSRDEALDQARTLFGGMRPGAFTPCAYIWPSTTRRHGFLSRFNYPKAIEPATRSGRRLGKYLAERQWSDVVLIGHSLGALVAAEAAKSINGEPLAVVLTGAAVRVLEMEELGAFEAPLSQREVVLHSSQDLVLRSVFKSGQTLAAPFAERSSAVGLEGEPSDRDWERLDCTRYDHRYWRHPETAAAVSAVVRGTQLPDTRRPPERGPDRRSPAFA